jgi:hypothetical protein
MPGKMARSDPRASVRVTRGAGSGQRLASVLQEGRENANIDAGLGLIWRISTKHYADPICESGGVLTTGMIFLLNCLRKRHCRRTLCCE